MRDDDQPLTDKEIAAVLHELTIGGTLLGALRRRGLTKKQITSAAEQIFKLMEGGAQ